MHIGQKVICVDDAVPPGKAPHEGVMPKKGMVYTIREIIPGPVRGYTDEDAVLLGEIINRKRDYRCPLGPIRCELTFRMSRFRPAPNIDVFLAMLDGKVEPAADSVVHLGKINEDEVRWSPTYEYMAAMVSIFDQLEGKSEAEADEMIWAEMMRMLPT